MARSYELPTDLETLSIGYLISKFGLGPFFIYLAIRSFHLNQLILSAFFCVPVTVLGVFFFNLTRIKPESGALAVRRFFDWQQIAYSEIKNCDDNLFMPFIGSVRLNSYVLPLGKIYFWVPMARHSYGIDKELIPYIRQRAGLQTE